MDMELSSLIRFVASVRGPSGSARSRPFVSWACAFGLTLAAAAGTMREARADAVRMTNGDILHGEVIGGDDKALHFKHVSGTDMTLDYDKIAVVETDKP